MDAEKPLIEEVNIPFVILEDDKEFDEQDDAKYLPVIIPQDDKHFNRMGFYCAIGEREEPKAKFDTILLLHKEGIDEKLKQIENYYHLDILRFETKIDDLKKKLEEEKFKLFTQIWENKKVSSLKIE